jgi:hypothetical protein
MPLKEYNHVLKRSFGTFSAEDHAFQRNYDIIIYKDDQGFYKLSGSTLDSLALFIDTRRDDLNEGGAQDFPLFCDNLMEDIARYIDMTARRGGYPYNHHSTFNVKTAKDGLLAELKLSSNPGHVSRYDPKNNKAHQGSFVGRPEEFRRMPY